jgi:alkyl hydroperoxide reductase subunit AhpC
VIALSVDPLDKAKEMAERVKASFPIAYGLEVPRDAEKVGAYWEERRKIIHATNFIIDGDKKVTQACFATGPIGRIVAEDALRSIQAAKRRKTQGS